jgi:hypothetical protein
MRPLARISLIAALGAACLLAVARTATAAEVTVVPPEALRYTEDAGILPLTFGEPSIEGVITRLAFTQAVIKQLYTGENFDGCFRNIAPSVPVKYTLLFSDVPKDIAYGKDLCVAIYVGLVDGKKDGSFRPNDPINLAEASKILAKAYGLIYPSPWPMQSAWYDPSMQALRERGVIAPNARPESILTARDMITIFYAMRDQERYPSRRIVGILNGRIATAPPSKFRPVNTTPKTRTEHISRRRLNEELRIDAMKRLKDQHQATAQLNQKD